MCVLSREKKDQLRVLVKDQKYGVHLAACSGEDWRAFTPWRKTQTGAPLPLPQEMIVIG